MMKWLDMPPVWLVGFLALAWVQVTRFDAGLTLDGVVVDFLGGLLVGGGFLLIALAFMEFRKHRTTIIPHETPARLIQSGIFSRTRNPIYLGDVMLLSGFILSWDAVLSLPLIPIFAWILEKRFIEPEEDRLRRTFRMDFARYAEKTRRWI